MQGSSAAANMVSSPFGLSMLYFYNFSSDWELISRCFMIRRLQLQLVEAGETAKELVEDQKLTGEGQFSEGTSHTQTECATGLEGGEWYSTTGQPS